MLPLMHCRAASGGEGVPGRSGEEWNVSGVELQLSVERVRPLMFQVGSSKCTRWIRFGFSPAPCRSGRSTAGCSACFKMSSTPYDWLSSYGEGHGWPSHCLFHSLLVRLAQRWWDMAVVRVLSMFRISSIPCRAH